jgi:uncharacterized protein (DUF1778 family)
MVKRRKPKAERKEELIRVRVTADQKQAFIEAADKEGLDVSSWLRRLGMRAVAGES